VAAADGDPSGVAVLSLAYDVFVPTSFTWGDFLAKAFSVDREPDRDYNELLDPPGAALGSPLSLLFFGGGTGWPVEPAPDALRKLTPTHVESLLISGALDVSTPPQTAQDEALPFLERGTQVVIPNASHVDDLWRLQPDAMQSLVTTFFDHGDVVDSFDAATPEVRVPLRLPATAKAAAIGAAITAAGVGAIAVKRHR
jgi:pimeloyl-ACP methyl ester carboxylesterase